MPFHPISCPICGVSYPLYHHHHHHHHHSSRTTPCNPSDNPQVAAHRQNFSVCLSERKRDIFSHTALFFSITPSLPLDGKCTRGRGWGEIRGKEGRGEQEIAKDVLWIKEVEIRNGMLLLYETG
jgi:hypothetical protein